MARGAAQEVLEIADAGDFHLNMPHRVLAILAWRDGDFAAAADHAASAAFLIRDQGDRYVQAASVRQLATLIGTVDAPLAAELLGIADGLVPEVASSHVTKSPVNICRAELDAALDPEELAGLVERGRRSDSRMAYATVDGHSSACAEAGSGPAQACLMSAADLVPSVEPGAGRGV